MAKSRNAFRTISEVAQLLDTPTHVLRFWESKFTQIRPVKRAGGRRYYRPDDVSLLSGIRKLLHDDGMTIKGVQKILREQGVKSVMAHQAPAIEALFLEEVGAQAPQQGTKPQPVVEEEPAQPSAPEPGAKDAAPTTGTPLHPEAPYEEAAPLPAQDNIVPFSLDRPAHQPSLFGAQAPAPGAAPRALAVAARVDPAKLRRKRKQITPLIARLDQLSGMLRSTP